MPKETTTPRKRRSQVVSSLWRLKSPRCTFIYTKISLVSSSPSMFRETKKLGIFHVFISFFQWSLVVDVCRCLDIFVENWIAEQTQSHRDKESFGNATISNYAFLVRVSAHRNFSRVLKKVSHTHFSPLPHLVSPAIAAITRIFAFSSRELLAFGLGNSAENTDSRITYSLPRSCIYSLT